MLWAAVWILLVLSSLAVFALLARSLWRKALALAEEMSAAGERVTALSDRLEEVRAAARQELAVFQDPQRLRRERDRARRAHIRARQRAAARAIARREMPRTRQRDVL